MGSIRRITVNFQVPAKDSSADGTIPPPCDIALEKHYFVWELAQLWGISERTIRRIFANEPGVVKWGREESRFKRAYTTLRIPDSVVKRVHRRLRQAG